jgi:hypothetical protein
MRVLRSVPPLSDRALSTSRPHRMSGGFHGPGPHRWLYIGVLIITRAGTLGPVLGEQVSWISVIRVLIRLQIETEFGAATRIKLQHGTRYTAARNRIRLRVAVLIYENRESLAQLFSQQYRVVSPRESSHRSSCIPQLSAVKLQQEF